MKNHVSTNIIPMKAGISRPRGVSLLISIIFVSFFMLALAGLAESQMHMIRSVGNDSMADKAFFLRETANEVALLAATQHGAGWNSTEDELQAYEENIWLVAQKMGVENCGAAVVGTKKEPCAGFSVIGRAAPEARVKLLGTAYYSVPAAVVDGEGAAAAIKGTGDAAESCTVPSGSDNAANDPCHWNKLKVGQTVEIPLYNDELDSPVFTAFKLRVRAPCPDLGSGCADSERVVLYPPVSNVEGAPYRDIKRDPVLVQWLISGTSTNGVSETLLANDQTERQFKNLRNAFPHINTELSAGRINDAKSSSDNQRLADFIVLEYTHQGKDPLNNDPDEEPPTIQSFRLQTPILRLTLVNQPHRNIVNQVQYNPAVDAGNPVYRVPFLEYQLLINCTIGVCAPGDSKEVLTGWVEVGNFRKEFTKYRRKEPSLGGFVLENF